MSFLLIVGMFLIYLNEITNLLDIHAINKGMLYMALSAWMTFCIANVTASFEMMVKGITLMGISGRIFFGVSVAVFLLSFFLYTPFTKYKRPAAKWTVARVVASLLVLAQMLASELISSHMLDGIGLTNGTVSTLSVVASVAMVIVAVAAVYLILVIDCIAIRRSAQRVNREHSSS